MTKEEIYAKLNELGTNEELAEKLKHTTSKEETVALFNEYGLEVTADEFDEVIMPLIEKVSNEKELSEGDLEDVSGGFFGTVAVGVGSFLLKCAGIGVAAWGAKKILDRLTK